ncbi:hypothetical protein MASR2M12_01080 [Bacteroidales bacterium]
MNPKKWNRMLYDNNFLRKEFAAILNCLYWEEAIDNLPVELLEFEYAKLCQEWGIGQNEQAI